MQYIYTDFNSLPVNITLTVGEINELIEFIANTNTDTHQWTVSNFEDLLTKSLKNTAVLMETESKSMKDKSNV